MSMFEIAVRQKLRFPSCKGDLSAEQLWDVPLRSKNGFDLDTIAKSTNRELKSVAEESFVETVTNPRQVALEMVLSIVKRVISVKLEEEQEAKTKAANQLEKQKLLRILSEKQDGKLSELSIKDLKKRIAALA